MLKFVWKIEKIFIIIFICLFIVIAYVHSIPPNVVYKIGDFNDADIWNIGYHWEDTSGIAREAVFSIFAVFIYGTLFSLSLGYLWTNLYSSKAKYNYKFWFYPICLMIGSFFVFILFKYPTYGIPFRNIQFNTPGYNIEYPREVVWIAQKRIMTIAGIALGTFITILYQMGIVNHDINERIQTNYKLRILIGTIIFCAGSLFLYVLFFHQFEFWERGGISLIYLSFLTICLGLFYIISSINHKNKFYIVIIITMLFPALFLYVLYLATNFNDLSDEAIVLSVALSIGGLIISMNGLNQPLGDLKKKPDNPEIPIKTIALLTLFMIILIYIHVEIMFYRDNFIHYLFIPILVISIFIIIQKIMYTGFISQKLLKLSIVLLLINLTVILFAPIAYYGAS
jgi:hypothetical protein